MRTVIAFPAKFRTSRSSRILTATSKAVMQPISCIRRNSAPPATRRIFPHPERLQVHPRFHDVRRMAELQVLPAQSADLLHSGFHHLPGLPHEARRRPRCPTTARSPAPSPRIAGLPEIPPCLFIMVSTSNCERPSISSEPAIISTSISSRSRRTASDEADRAAGSAPLTASPRGNRRNLMSSSRTRTSATL